MGAKGSQSPVAGGQFVTRLARGLGIWSIEEEDGLFTRVGDIRPLSLDTLKTMLLVKQVGRDWVLCVGPTRQPWVRPVQHHVGGDAAEGVEGEGVGAGHEEPEGEAHFDLPPPQHDFQYDAPQHPFGPPPGYQFADASQFDQYTAYNHMMAAMANLGSGLHQVSTQMHSLRVDYQRTKRRMGASYRGLDQRVTNLSDTVYGMRDDLTQVRQDLTQFRQDFYDYRDQTYDPASAMDEDDDEEDEDDDDDDDAEE